MNASDYLVLLATLFVRHIPTLVVALIGLWFAIARRRSLGRVCSWAVWGFSLLIAYAFISAILQFALVSIQISEVQSGARGESITQVGLWMVATHPIFIAGLAVLARAVFLDRRTGGVEEMGPQPILSGGT